MAVPKVNLYLTKDHEAIADPAVWEAMQQKLKNKRFAQ